MCVGHLVSMQEVAMRISFTDDYSRYGYVYLMKKKSYALDKFKEFKAESEKQLGRHIKSFRSDRGCDAQKPGGPLTTRQPAEYS